MAGLDSGKIRPRWRRGWARLKIMCQKLYPRHHVKCFTCITSLNLIHLREWHLLFSSDEDIFSCVQGFYNKVTFTQRLGRGVVQPTVIFCFLPYCEAGLVSGCCIFHELTFGSTNI